MYTGTLILAIPEKEQPVGKSAFVKENRLRSGEKRKTNFFRKASDLFDVETECLSFRDFLECNSGSLEN